MSWTSPGDLREQVKKLWERGDLLASVVQASVAQASVVQASIVRARVVQTGLVQGSSPQEPCDTGNLSSIVREISAAPSVFPKRLNLKCPTATELRDHFDEARNWIKKLREMPHVRMEWREFNHRTLGANSLRITRVLSNSPIKSRVSGCSRAATGIATSRSDWPL